MPRYKTGVSRKDKTRNGNIRQTLGIEEKLTDKVREGLQRWFGHAHGRGNTYVGKKAMTLRIGNRKRGRSNRRWSDCTKEDLNSVLAVGADAQARVS